MASWGLYPFRRPELVGFVPDAQASVALPAVAVAAAVLQVAVEVEHAVPELAAVVAPAVNAPADPAHVSSAAAVAAVLLEAPVGFEPEPVHDAFVVVAAAAEQLRVAVVAVAVALVLRRVRPAVVVVAQVEQRVQPSAHFAHVPHVAARSVVVAAVAPCDAGRVVLHGCQQAAVELVALAEQLAVTTFAPFAEHHVRDAHLSPRTSVPSRAQVQYSRAGPSPDSDGIAALSALCS